jgi:hypothetical protein
MILEEDESKNKDIPFFIEDCGILEYKKRGETSSLLTTAIILDQFNHHVSNRLLFIFICD